MVLRGVDILEEGLGDVVDKLGVVLNELASTMRFKVAVLGTCEVLFILW